MAAITENPAPIVQSTNIPRPASYYIKVTLRYLLLIAIGVIMLSPFILAMLGTFKTDVEITAFPPKLLPATWLWENWLRFGTPMSGKAVHFHAGFLTQLS